MRCPLAAERLKGVRGYEQSGRGDASVQDRHSGAARPPALERWHRLVVLALGITWILDGLEVSSSRPRPDAAGPAHARPHASGRSASRPPSTSSARSSARSFFGRLTDRLGRKKLFLVTLALYLVATALDGLVARRFACSSCSRFFAGAGIGGEYSAINSAIDELVPARVRGQVDLAINGSYWIGTIFGSIASIFLLNPKLIADTLGWRLCFAIGPVLAFAILIVRRYVPEPAPGSQRSKRSSTRRVAATCWWTKRRYSPSTMRWFPKAS